MKEQTRNTEVQIKEEEISKLPEKEFRIMIVKMIKNLENKMEKMQESISKDLEELKNKHTETSNRVMEIKSTLKVKSLSRVRLFVTPWTVAYQAPLSMGFSRQEYWSGLPFPSPGDLPDLGIKPGFPALEADALTSELPGKPN